VTKGLNLKDSSLFCCLWQWHSMYYDRGICGENPCESIKNKRCFSLLSISSLRCVYVTSLAKISTHTINMLVLSAKNNSFNIFAPSSFANIKMIGLIFLMMKSIFQIWY